MEKSNKQKTNTHQKKKTKGVVQIPGGFREVMMGSSKEAWYKQK